MNSREYIESGILELYVFGKLSEEEKLAVQQMAADNPAIRTEIAAIEKAVMNLSYSVSPNISSETYDKIRRELLGSDAEVIQLKQKTNWTQYLGWAASFAVLLARRNPVSENERFDERTNQFRNRKKQNRIQQNAANGNHFGTKKQSYRKHDGNPSRQQQHNRFVRRTNSHAFSLRKSVLEPSYSSRVHRCQKFTRTTARYGVSGLGFKNESVNAYQHWFAGKTYRFFLKNVPCG